MCFGDCVPKFLHEDKSLLHLLSAYAISGLGSILAIGLAFTVMFLPIPDLQLLVLSPLVQQTSKPIGVLGLLEKRPLWFRRRLHVAGACLLAGAVFGVLESLAWVGYMHLEGRTFAHFFGYRCAANIVMHLLSSGVLAVGLARGYRAGYKHGLLEYRKLLPFYALAVLLHIALNGGMRYLAILGVVDIRLF